MSSRSATVVDEADAWIRKKTFGELMEKAELRNLLSELSNDDAYWTGEREKFNELFETVDAYLRTEDRPLKEILRKGMADKIVSQVAESEIDPDIVKAFMRTPAVESMAGAILYTGIFEFIQRADILGNIVNTLPIIGPIRKEVNKALKDTLDQTLGSQIKDFLGTNSRPAVEQMISFILANENKKAFAGSASRLAAFVMARPVSSLLPSKETSLGIRNELWDVSRGVVGTVADQESLLDTFFEEYGGKEFGSVVPELPATMKRGMLKVWQKFLDSEGSGLGLSDSAPHPGRIREFE